jgi:hypothetical protein
MTPAPPVPANRQPIFSILLSAELMIDYATPEHRDQRSLMTVQQFESISLFLGIGGLVAYMVYIMFRLAQESNAGRFGSFVIFGALGLGIVGFAAKSVIQYLVLV